MLRKNLAFVVMGTVMFLLAAVSSAQVPTVMNYQGKLTTAQGGCVNDTVQMTFTIYADDQGTVDEWSETHSQVIVKEGVFSVLLGSQGSPIPPSLFDGSIKYLGVQVESDPEMSPLKPLVSVGYAFQSAAAAPDADWEISGDDIYHLNGNVGIGAPASGLLELQVVGRLAPAWTGGPVRGSKQPSASYRFGDGSENTGFSSAYVNQISAITDGVERMLIDNNGNIGIGTSAPGWPLHVATSRSRAGYFTSDSLSGGTHVVHSSFTGSGPRDAKAFYGYSRPEDGFGIGGEFEGGCYGVRGVVNPTGSAYYCGVSGSASGGTGAIKTGVYGVGGGSGTNYGVYGYAAGGGINYGVYYSNGLGGSGSKSCIVKTSQGPTALYCQESPENWFEDFGEGTLVNGQTHIELDALFLETVTINAANPMKVFVQLEGDCNGVYVSKGITGFDVIELKDGTSNVPFSYRVVAKRKGFEDKRLDYTAAGENDPYLYPEAAERMEKERLENAGE